MAKKFKDLSGVSLVETYTYRDQEPRIKHTTFAYASDSYKYEIEKDGDTLYMLDRKNNYEIVELIAKRVSINYRGAASIKACLASDNVNMKGYIPYCYGSGDEKYKEHLITFCIRGNRSHSGLFFTTIEEATEWQAKLRNGECFISLKPGDTVYLVVNGKYLLEKKVARVGEANPDGSGWYGNTEFVLTIEGIGSALLDNLRFEDKASDLLDIKYYTYQMNFKKDYGYGCDIKIFMKKSDAEKSISDTAKRKQKSATVKYLKEIENHDGKPISFTDKKGKQLHYGDRVAYAVSGGSSAPYISFGIVKGESKTKVSILDEDKGHDGKDVKHSVYPTSVLLVKEAEFNTNSGYSFVKTK
jgi:hypothetical protein